jgi:Phospholipase_D-nuclease N-terminal
MTAAILASGIALIPLMFILFILVPLAIVATILWIWMLVSAIQNKGLTDGEKVAWVLVIVFLHLLGAILYFFIGHPKRRTPLVTA